MLSTSRTCLWPFLGRDVVNCKFVANLELLDYTFVEENFLWDNYVNMNKFSLIWYYEALRF